MAAAKKTKFKSYKVNDRRGKNRVTSLDSAPSKHLLGAHDNPAQFYDIKRLDSKPYSVRDALRLARYWHQHNLMIQSGLWLKIGFHNHGFTVRPAERSLKTDQRTRFKQWWMKHGQAINRFVRETWEDYLMMDNAVAFWRSVQGNIIPRVFTLRPEDCNYTDPMGLEKLKVRLGFRQEDMRNMNVSRDFIRRYASGQEIELDEDRGEHFRVLKRERVGWGFKWPRIDSIFHTLDQQESMEVADSLWAHLSRAVTRHFKLGHEIRNGPRAGFGTWFWTKKRGEAVKKFFENRLGILDYTSNFDVGIEFPYPSTERFDKSKYESVLQRLSLWLGPVGMMLLNPRPTDFPLRFLKASVHDERQEVAWYLNEIINTVFNPPVPVQCQWSSKIFMDVRQSLELLKFLLASGPLSQQTALEEAGYQTEEERERKAEEADLLNNEETKDQVLPVFDPAHGQRPGNPSGRPAGVRDGGPRASSNNGNGDPAAATHTGD